MIKETSGGDVSAGGPAEPEADRWLPSQIAAVAVVAMGGLMVSLNQSLLIPVLPRITQDLGSSTDSTEWLLTSTLLTAGVAVPIMGRLGDMYGKRLMLMVCAGFLSRLAHLRPEPQPRPADHRARGDRHVDRRRFPRRQPHQPDAAPAPRAVRRRADQRDARRRGRVGLPLAGFVGEHANYHVLFWIGVVGGCVSLLGSWLFLTESAQRPAGRFDFPGAILFALALVCLLLPLSEAATWGWGAPRTIGLLAASAVLLFVSCGSSAGSGLRWSTWRPTPSRRCC